MASPSGLERLKAVLVCLADAADKLRSVDEAVADLEIVGAVVCGSLNPALRNNYASFMATEGSAHAGVYFETEIIAASFAGAGIPKANVFSLANLTTVNPLWHEYTSCLSIVFL